MVEGAIVEVINLREVIDYLRRMPEETFDDFKREVGRSLLEADANIKTNTELQRRSGALMQSIRTTNTGNSMANYKASIHSDMVYAPVQEGDNGRPVTIRAKDKYQRVPGGPYLNIPTQANKTPAGVTRLMAREVFNQGGRVIQYKPFKYGVILNGVMMFTLHKEVDIPPRLKMVESTEAVVPALLDRLRNVIGDY